MQGVQFHSLALSSTTTPALVTSAYGIRPLNDAGVLVSPTYQGIGARATAAFFVKCVDSGVGTFTGATVKVQISYDGAAPTTAAATNWIDIYCTNVATASTAIEHTVTPSSGATAWLALATESTRNAPYVRVLGKATGGDAGSGDTLDVYVVAS